MIKHVFELIAEVGPDGVIFSLETDNGVALDPDGNLFELSEKDCSPALLNDRLVIREMIAEKLSSQA